MQDERVLANLSKKGLLGSAVVDQLASAGFAVTVLTRDSKALKGLPEGVQAVDVDYTSVESLTAALRGQDAAVCTLGTTAVTNQRTIIDAAIAAGVKRYIPSDFGSFTSDTAAQAVMPFLASLTEIRKYLAEKAQEGALEYTAFATGAFLELVLAMPFAADLTKRSVRYHDDGKHLFSTSSIVTIGKAVAAALKTPEATKNRALFVHDTVISQYKLVALAKKYAPEGWTETRVDGETEYQEAREAQSKAGPSLEATYRLLGAALLGGKFAGAYTSVDNASLGLGTLSDADLETKIASLYK